MKMEMGVSRMETESIRKLLVKNNLYVQREHLPMVQHLQNHINNLPMAIFFLSRLILKIPYTK